VRAFICVCVHACVGVCVCGEGQGALELTMQDSIEIYTKYILQSSCTSRWLIKYTGIICTGIDIQAFRSRKCCMYGPFTLAD